MDKIQDDATAALRAKLAAAESEVARLCKLQDAWEGINLPLEVPISYSELILKLAAAEKERGEAVIAFAKAALHGDDAHRTWLTEAAQAFIQNKPLPEPNGKGTDRP